MRSKSSGLATASIGTQEGEWRPGTLILMLREGERPETLTSTLRAWFPLLGTIRGRMGARLAGQLQPRTRARMGTLTESQRQMAEEFRRGMAEALGVPPEAIREDVVQRWIMAFTQALVKPEYWVEVAPTIEEVRELGKGLGKIARSAYFRR